MFYYGFRKRYIFGIIAVVVGVTLGIATGTKEHVLTCNISEQTCVTYHKNNIGKETIKNHTNPYKIRDIRVDTRTERYHTKHGTRTRTRYDVCFYDTSGNKDCIYTTGNRSFAEDISLDLKNAFSKCKGCKQVKYDLHNLRMIYD